MLTSEVTVGRENISESGAHRWSATNDEIPSMILHPIFR